MKLNVYCQAKINPKHGDRKITKIKFTTDVAD